MLGPAGDLALRFEVRRSRVSCAYEKGEWRRDCRSRRGDGGVRSSQAMVQQPWITVGHWLDRQTVTGLVITLGYSPALCRDAGPES